MFFHLGRFFCLFVLGFFGFFFFLVLACLLPKGEELRYSPGRGNAGRYAVMLYVGEGPRGSNGACFTLLRISILHSDTHN